jgi:hypothetical protein
MDPAEYQAWQLEQFVNLLAKVGMVSNPNTLTVL